MCNFCANLRDFVTVSILIVGIHLTGVCRHHISIYLYYNNNNNSLFIHLNNSSNNSLKCNKIMLTTTIIIKMFLQYFVEN